MDVTSGIARRVLGGVAARKGPSSTASVPITLLLYNGPLLRGFNVHIKGLTVYRNIASKQRNK